MNVILFVQARAVAALLQQVALTEIRADPIREVFKDFDLGLLRFPGGCQGDSDDGVLALRVEYLDQTDASLDVAGFLGSGYSGHCVSLLCGEMPRAGC